jgi:hypothetical protein
VALDIEKYDPLVVQLTAVPMEVTLPDIYHQLRPCGEIRGIAMNFSAKKSMVALVCFVDAAGAAAAIERFGNRWTGSGRRRREGLMLGGRRAGVTPGPKGSSKKIPQQQLAQMLGPAAAVTATAGGGGNGSSEVTAGLAAAAAPATIPATGGSNRQVAAAPAAEPSAAPSAAAAAASATGIGGSSEPRVLPLDHFVCLENLPLTATESEVAAVLEPCGPIQKISIMPTSSQTGLRVFVSFVAASSASAAMCRDRGRVVVCGQRAKVQRIPMETYRKLARKGCL